MERLEWLTDVFAWLVDVFAATKALPRRNKERAAMAMRALRIEVVLDFILPPMRAGWERRGRSVSHRAPQYCRHQLVNAGEHRVWAVM